MWCTKVLTFQKFTFCHTIFTCFIFNSQQMLTFAPHHRNWLVFITEMKSVYSAVRTGSLNKAVCASSLKGFKEEITGRKVEGSNERYYSLLWWGNKHSFTLCARWSFWWKKAEGKVDRWKSEESKVVGSGLSDWVCKRGKKLSIWSEFGIWNLEGCILTNSDEV